MYLIEQSILEKNTFILSRIRNCRLNIQKIEVQYGNKYLYTEDMKLNLKCHWVLSIFTDCELVFEQLLKKKSHNIRCILNHIDFIKPETCIAYSTENNIRMFWVYWFNLWKLIYFVVEKFCFEIESFQSNSDHDIKHRKRFEIGYLGNKWW